MKIPRRNFLKSSGLALGAGLLPWPSYMSKLLFPEGGEMKLLRNNVGAYTNRGGTIAWLIDAEGVAVVDSQFPEEAGDLIGRIREQTDRRIDLLLNTHHHRDHSSGNIAFKEIVDQVVAHQNSRINQENVAKEAGTEADQLYPDTVFEREWSRKVGTETVTARYFDRAHTNGDAVIHFENANVAHLGDLMFNRRFPNIDMKAGASVQRWIKVLNDIRKTYDDDTLFIFGHAGEGYELTGSKEDLKAMENYLSSLLIFIKKEIEAGKSLDDLLNAGLTSIPGAEEWKGHGIERSLRAAYEELTEQ
jgi:cyclase